MLMYPAEGQPDQIPTYTHYVLYDDGSTGKVDTTSEELPELPKPGRLVAESVYEERLAELIAAKERHQAEVEEQIRTQTRDDYDALTAAGIPDATARRLTGFQGV